MRGYHLHPDSSARRILAAQLRGKNTYEGAPCYKCGGTERYICKNRCKRCKDRDNNRRYHLRKSS